jgi:ER-bound oxygenase mpaB/B'/Rubber oxygenase, catalytic domain
MTNKWTNELLDSMREVMDPLADEVVTKVIQSGGLEAFDQLMRHLVNNRDVISDALPPIVHDFFEQTKILPGWTDQAKIDQGEDVFELYGPEMIMMLFFVSLPYAYATKKGSHVLAITSELTKHVHRRIFRTAQFIMDVMQDGGLGPNGRGIRSTQKVRLLHASIRYYIANQPKWAPKWDAVWGAPINQEDLAGTLMDFTVGVMKGLERFRIRLSQKEAEAYLHCWKVVGYIMGIRPELIPENVEDAYDLANTIIARQQGASESGKLLSKDLISFMQRFMPRPFHGFPATATRYLSGDQIADVIEVGPFDWTLTFLKLQMFLFDMAEKLKYRFPGAHKYIRFVTWSLIERVVIYEEGNQGTYFEIPDHLRKHWRLSRSR